MDARILPRTLCLAAAALLPALAVAAPTQPGTAPHHGVVIGPSSSTAAPAPHMEAMHERMQRMRETDDADERMRLMEEHMAAMEAMMKDGATCAPMSGNGHARHHGGSAMRDEPGHHGMDHHADADHHRVMELRIESLEKRLDLMQTLLQLQAGRPVSEH
ncbi:MAG: hypothetical protein H2060_06395 [Azoarcus sp.]|nr:hypothetical protein [Azoarcus sp.]